MTPIDIKIELMRAGISMADIGRRCGLTRQAVSMVISGVNRSVRAEQAIAAALGRQVDELFPPKQRKQNASRKGNCSVWHKNKDAIDTLIETEKDVNI